MKRFSAQTASIATTLLLAAFGCSDHDAADSQTDDPSEETDERDVSSDGLDDEPNDELREIFAASIAAYDRQVASHCPCFVHNGAYETIEECLEWQKSADDWVSCGTEALRPHDSPELRENLRCVAQRADNNTECNNQIACEAPERTSCSESLLLCFVQMSDVVLVLDEKCPDFSLLPRERARVDGRSD